MYKQLIIVRKDLPMHTGKVAAQVSHASMAFLTKMIQEHATKVMERQYPTWCNHPITNEKIPQRYRRADLNKWSEEARERGDEYFYACPVNPNDRYGEFMLCEPNYHYECSMQLDKDLYDQWMGGIFTKVVCEAKNKNQLLKAVKIAEELGLTENKDFFIIRDACLTDIEPEEFDENGVGRTITCIGFRPMEQELMEQISKKFQLMK